MKTILHCDINNFFASVEVILNPELINKPVIVCGDPENRNGIVLAKSQKAKECGVKTAETLAIAIKKCPDAVLVKPSYATYIAYSKKFFNICFQYSNLIESFGIDECWIDITHLVSKNKKEYIIAKELSRRVKNELGLTVSIGVSFSKTFAKIGSDYKKPNCITEITVDNYQSLIYPLPIEALLNIGCSMKNVLHKFNVFTIGDLANLPEEIVVKHFNKNGQDLYLKAKGSNDDTIESIFDKKNLPKSLGNGCTLSEDIFTYSDASKIILALSQYISFRLKTKNFLANGVKLTLKLSNLKVISKQSLINNSFNSADSIMFVSLELLSKIYNLGGSSLGIKAITINMLNIQSININQLSFLEKLKFLNNLETKVFDIKKKHGYDKLIRGTDIENNINLKLPKSEKEKFFSFQIFNVDF